MNVHSASPLKTAALSACLAIFIFAPNALAEVIPLEASLVLNPCLIQVESSECEIRDPEFSSLSIELKKSFESPSMVLSSGVWKKTAEAHGIPVQTVVLISETLRPATGTANYEIDVIINFPTLNETFSVTTQFPKLSQMNPIELRSKVIQSGTAGTYPIFYLRPATLPF